jgi:Rieske Fe-S protein
MNERIAKSDGGTHECGGCPLVTDRREFLKGASAIALAALSLALPIRSVSATIVTSAISGRGKSVTYSLPPADGVDIDRDNDVLLVRYQGFVYAFSLSCPHQNTALRWNDADGRFQCPKHHSQYTPDGVFITGRATRNMDRLMIRRDVGNRIVVDPDTLYQSDDDPTEWKNAVVKL